jgi:CHAT domain-containing protein
LGVILQRKSDLAAAKSLFERSLALTRRTASVESMRSSLLSEAIALEAIGSVLEESGEYSVALSYYRDAVAVREKIRSSVGVDEFRSGFATLSVSVYQRLIPALVRHGSIEEAYNYAERARARTFIEGLSQRRLDFRAGPNAELLGREQELRLELAALERDYDAARTTFHDGSSPIVRSIEGQLSTKRTEYEQLHTRIKLTGGQQAALVDVATLPATDVLRHLEENVALISFFVTPEKTIVFVLKRSGMVAIELAVRETELEDAIRQFRSFPMLEGMIEPDADLVFLYERLIAPLEPYLKKVSLIGIVPHGVLHYLPFGALTDGRSFLADRVALFYLPSIDLLGFVRSGEWNRETSRVRALVMAHSRKGYPFLERAITEARRVAVVYGEEPLVGELASETAFRLSAPQSGVVHIAAHGELNAPRPIFSRLLLARDDHHDGALDIYEIFGFSLDRVDLVVLSACQTQLGARSGGDEIVTLNRAFLAAHANTVVASLWSVNDEASAALMEHLHTYLKAGLPKAIALQQAQMAVRAVNPHPYYWAGFVLNGDPGTGLAPQHDAAVH